MTRAQRIAVRWFRWRSLRFRVAWHVPFKPDAASMFKLYPGRLICLDESATVRGIRHNYGSYAKHEWLDDILTRRQSVK